MDGAGEGLKLFADWRGATSGSKALGRIVMMPVEGQRSTRPPRYCPEINIWLRLNGYFFFKFF